MHAKPIGPATAGRWTDPPDDRALFAASMRSSPRVVALGLLVEVPLIVLVWLAIKAGWHGDWYYDFLVFRRAGDAVMHGHSPYVAPTATLLAQNDRFVYPQPFAFLFAPFALVPPTAAKVAFSLMSLAALGLALRLLGVRDWRCYAVALLGSPVIVAFSLGTIGPVLLLLVAAAWRYRDRLVAGVLLALAAAFKLFLWPVLVWLVATRRLRASAASLVTLAFVGGVWALADPEGLRRYPTTLRVFNDVERWKSYSLESLAMRLGSSPRLGETLTIAVAIAGTAIVASLSTRPEGDRRGLAAAIATSLLATPILWSHYLVLVLVPIALARPRLAPLWLAPVGLLFVTPSTESGGVAWRMAVLLVVTLGVGIAATLAERPQPRRRTIAAPFRSRESA